MTGWNLPPGVSEFDEHINPSDDAHGPPVGTTLPGSERHAVMNWARQSAPALWKAVPGAREFMVVAAAMRRAEAEFYGPLETAARVYLHLADSLLREGAHRE